MVRKARNFFSFVLIFVLSLALTVSAAALPESVIVGGEAIGITARSDGVIIAELSEVETANGKRTPAKDAGLRQGDIIKKIGNSEIHDAANLTAALGQGSAKTEIVVQRGNMTLTFPITPAEGIDGTPSLGIWARDSIAGIGTLTFINPETGRYGALGHEIDDADTGESFRLREGSIFDAKVTSIDRGGFLSPGKLDGEIVSANEIGTVDANGPSGIFGIWKSDIMETDLLLPIASDEEVSLGKCTIICTVNGKEQVEYEAEISRILTSGEDDIKILC